MKTKELYRYFSKIFEEEDWVQPPSIHFSQEDEEYVSFNQIKKSKGILFSCCSESDSILFLIQTISKNIILHIQDSERDSFIRFFQHQLNWIERGAIQKIYVCHSNQINDIDDYMEYLHDHYQLSKTYYLGKLSKEIWIGVTPEGIFTTSISKL